jgi:hypothetical protein
MNIIPATAELFGKFYGKLPFAVPSMRAYFLIIDGEPVGICGFIHLWGDQKAVFTEGRGDVYENHKLSIMKFAKAMLKIADENKWTLVCNRDETLEHSGLFLAYLGFRPDEFGEYVRWAV